MMDYKVYAHSANSRGEWHSLIEHLKEVANINYDFADTFSVGDLGYYVGLWHDTRYW